MNKSTTRFKSKVMGSNNSGCIEFDLTIYFNNHGIISNWKIEIFSLSMWTGSQKSWFDSKSVSFRFRERIFDLLGEKQVVGHKSGHLVKVEDKNTLKIIEGWFNCRHNKDKSKLIFKSTLKTIDQIARGNNWSGSFSNPSASNLLSSEFAPGSILLIDELIKLDYRSTDILEMISIEMKFNELFNLKPELREMYDYVNKEKINNDYKNFKEHLSQYRQKYLVPMTELIREIKTARNKYSYNIDKFYRKYPFGLKSKDDFQKAHIYDVHRLKENIFNDKLNNKNYIEWMNMISDHENFIPLEESIHRRFDKNNFSYDEEGFLFPINEKGRKELSDSIFNGYRKIDEWFMTPGRKKYLKLRNDELK